MSFFSCTNYREIIRFQLKEHSPKRGFQSTLAKFLGCSPSFLSQVLKDKVHLTPDQAALFCDFWKLNQLECDFFLNLVNLERASTVELQAKIAKWIDALRSKGQKQGFHSQTERSIPLEGDAVQYWSAWHYPAVYEGISHAIFKTREDIAERFSLPMATVDQILSKLKSFGMIEEKNRIWKATNKNFYETDDVALTKLFHDEIHRHSLEKYDAPQDEDLHYVQVAGIAKSEIPELKQMILDLINRQRLKMKRSGDQELVCFSYHLFKM
ncbi:MAG: TIGR02147 family protein [Proteobacteria bacterium]|nr:MAG: TIGR02147 family protein [Pseudomonadota bacterium]